MNDDDDDDDDDDAVAAAGLLSPFISRVTLSRRSSEFKFGMITWGDGPNGTSFAIEASVLN